MTIVTEKPEEAGWNDRRVELLKTLWADDRSCSEIAGVLGGGLTRNAVIGKVHRLGLSGRPRTPSSPAKRRVRKPRGERRMVQRIANHGTRFDVTEVMEGEPLPEETGLDIPLAQRCTLLDLDSNKCKWPIGDPATPEFFFCGGKAAGEGPYCGYHSRVAYQGGRG